MERPRLRRGRSTSIRLQLSFDAKEHPPPSIVVGKWFIRILKVSMLFLVCKVDYGQQNSEVRTEVIAHLAIKLPVWR